MPASPGIAQVEITPVSNVGLSVSPFTGQQQTQEWVEPGWAGKVNLPPMRRSAAAAWLAWMVSLHGMANFFMLGDPAGRTPRGVATGAPLVDGSNNGGYTIGTRGWTPNVNGILLAGDWIQVGNHLHMIVNDENSDSGGKAAFDIWPSLREVPGDGLAIITSNAKGMFRLANNKPSWSTDEAQIYGISFECFEAF